MSESKFQFLLKRPQHSALIISYICTFWGFSIDILNYLKEDTFFLAILNGATLPFFIWGFGVYLLNMNKLKISAGILIITLTLNIYASTIYSVVQNTPLWEHYFLRDSVLIAVFIIITGFLLSNLAAYIINVLFCSVVVFIWLYSTNQFIDDNVIYLILMMTGFTVGIAFFTTTLRKSIHKNDELLELIARQKEEILKKENELIAQRVSQLENTLEVKNKELVSSAMLFAENIEARKLFIKKLNEFNAQLPLEKSNELNMLIKEISVTSNNHHWKEFQLRFEDVHQSFYQNLQSNFPDLSPAELKLAAFIKLKLSSKEIALLTNITKNSVDVARSKLRKKLGMTNSDNMVLFLDRF